MSHDETTPQPPMLGENGRILEGIVATRNPDGSANVSPMGPIVDERFERLWLRPFSSSTTYRNLKRTGQGVFHVTDDVELLAHAAVGQPTPAPRFLSSGEGGGLALADACRWYAFEVEAVDDADERTSFVARVVERGELREFLGFNRAKHAVLEAAILATRIRLLEPHTILSEMNRLKPLIDKTGAVAEHRAWDFLQAYIEQALHESTNKHV